MTKVATLFYDLHYCFQLLFLLSSNITAFSYCFCFRYDLALRLSVILSLFFHCDLPLHSSPFAL